MITKSELEHIKGALKTALKTALIRRIGMRNGGAETMAMPQRDDTIEAIKRRAAEKKAAEEKRPGHSLFTGEAKYGIILREIRQ